jgi:CTP:molybdopterin cytidylyltransferase MocA
MNLKNTEGAKQLIKRHIHAVFSIPFPDGAIDIDTPKDYEQLKFCFKFPGFLKKPGISSSFGF